MTAIAIDLAVMRGQLQPLIDAGEDGITEDVAETIGNALLIVLGELHGTDRLAALAGAISPRTVELDAIAETSGFTDGAREHVDLQLGLVLMGLDGPTRNAVLACWLLEDLERAIVS